MVCGGSGMVCDGSGIVCGGSGMVCGGSGMVCGGSGMVCGGSGMVCGGSGMVCGGSGMVCGWRVVCLGGFLRVTGWLPPSGHPQVQVSHELHMGRRPGGWGGPARLTTWLG